MQAQTPISTGSGTDTRRRATGALHKSLGMALLILFSVTPVPAQTDTTNKPAPAESSSAQPASPAKSSAPVASTAEPVDDDAAKTDPEQQVQDSNDTRPDRLSSLRSQIEEAKTEVERSRLRRMLVDYLVALNRTNEAINELRSMSNEDRLDPVAFYNIGNALARLGDRDSAIAAYRKAIKQRHGNYARAHNNLGVLLMRQGRWDEAQESLTSALKLENFRYSEASYNLGRLYSARGEADLAMREWSRALLVQPDHADAAIALARAYAEDGKPERGVIILDNFISRRGSSPELVDARREILFGNRANSSAPSAPTSAGSEPPMSGKRASTPVANSDSVSNNRPAVVVKPRRDKLNAPALRPLTVDQQTQDLLERARAAREADRHEEAASLYRRVLLRNNGFLPPANLELSFVLSSLKHYDEAVASLTTLVDREGARYPIAYYHLGRQYEAMGRLNRAAESFERAAEAYGESNPQFLLDLSRVREKEGNLTAAVDAMESYIRISRSLGRVPEWSTQRLAELRKKIGTSAARVPEKQ